MVAVSPLVRLIFEYWGAVTFANDILHELMAGGDVERAVEKCARVTMGARVPVKLPWGAQTEVRSYNVMEFVRRLQEDDAEALQLYEFLCEACHPSFFQHLYFHLASKRYPEEGFPSEALLKHAEELLATTVIAAERALQGLYVQSAKTLKLAAPEIKAFNTSQ